MISIFTRRCFTASSSIRQFVLKDAINSGVESKVSKETRGLIRLKALSARNATQMLEQIDSFYIPLYDYLFHQCTNLREKYNRTIFVGVSAPQGCGKTTLTDYMTEMFTQNGWRCLSVSIDDFYLTGQEQIDVAAAHPNNPLLQYRGNAGTHDMKLLLDTLTSAASISPSTDIGSVSIRVPRYEKSLRNGRGDRVPIDEWTDIQGPIDVVILEGWMLGFEPVSEADEGTCDGLQTQPGMLEVNGYLREFKRVHELMDLWVILGVDDSRIVNDEITISHDDTHSSINEDKRQVEEFLSSVDAAVEISEDRNASVVDGIERQVFSWRWQAEEAMSKAGKAALSQEQVRDFVSRFMPAYRIYLPNLLRNGPQRRRGQVPYALPTQRNLLNPISNIHDGAYKCAPSKDEATILYDGSNGDDGGRSDSHDLNDNSDDDDTIPVLKVNHNCHDVLPSPPWIRW